MIQMEGMEMLLDSKAVDRVLHKGWDLIRPCHFGGSIVYTQLVELHIS